MKRLFTLLIAGAFPVFSSFAQLPVKVMGDMVVASGGTMTSSGNVILNATPTANAKLVNKGTLNLKKGVTFVSTEDDDATLLNEGTVNLNGSVASDVKVIKTFSNDPARQTIGTDHPFSLPFPVNLLTTKDSDGNVAYKDANGKYMFYIERYNKEKRAMRQKAWEWLDDCGVNIMNANDGYVLRLSTSIIGSKTLVFQASDISNLYKAHDVVVPLTYTPSTSGLGDDGWVYVGSQQTTDFLLTEAHLNGFTYPMYYFNKTTARWEDFYSDVDDHSMAHYSAIFAQIDANQNLTFKSTGRDKRGNLHFRSENVKEGRNFLQMNLEKEGQAVDRLRIFSDDEYDNNFKTGEDAMKMLYDSASQIYTKVGEVALGANKNKLSTIVNDEIPVYVNLEQQGEYSFNVGRLEGYDNNNIYLLDKKLNEVQDLKENPTYSFISDVENITDRFVLRFTQDYTNINNISTSGVIVYTEENTVFVKNIKIGDSVQIFDISGALVKKGFASSEEESYYVPAKGLYIVKVEGSTSFATKTLVK